MKIEQHFLFYGASENNNNVDWDRILDRKNEQQTVF